MAVLLVENKRLGTRRFGNLIRALRKDQGWSHDKLAREAKLAKQTIINVEKMDKPEVQEKTLDGLAAAFSTNATELLRWFHNNIHPLIIPVSKEAAEVLDRAARELGITPEEVAARWITESVRKHAKRLGKSGAGASRLPSEERPPAPASSTQPTAGVWKRTGRDKSRIVEEEDKSGPKSGPQS
jgi:transcriptional regulator with XRE-family HTH domain